MALRDAILSRFARSNGMARARRASLHSNVRGIEILEERQLLSTFTVSNLNASGAGSLRWAINQANEVAGSDTIDFGVAGTIRVGKTSLPSITGAVTIDGTSAPSYAGSPVVTVNFQGSKGFNFAKGSDGSDLKALSIVSASNAGVTLGASNVTVEGNDIGLLANGSTVAGNRGDGIQINASSHGDLIGHADPVTGVSYYNADSANSQPVSAWQGIRGTAVSGQYLLTGTSGSNGLLYEGPISGVGGTSFNVNYPGATSTSVYGPDVTASGGIRLVGSYKAGNGVVNGFLFQGTTASLSVASDYQTIDYPGAKYTYIHSTMGDLAVGNADGPEGNSPLGTGHALLYDVATSTMLPNIVYPGSTTTTAYGIWYNGGTSYTIAGGYSNPANANGTVSNGYMVDYDSLTGQYSHWASYAYPNGLVGQDYITHFEGISSAEKGVYTLVADSVQTGSSNAAQGSVVTVDRNADGSFGTGAWVDLNVPGVSVGIASANSVAGNQVVGLDFGNTGILPYQATVNTGFQLSNVISGNSGNGIGIYGASNNQIAMNNIGTDATGTLRRANGKNGILITQGASGNLIGGQATGGNDPTNSVFVRPPQGNLISANNGDGVLINQGATRNQLSGNFVGTTGSGNSALGNKLNGVDIENAGGNQLLGCTIQQDPFVVYNVLSGNGGNGLQITNSNNTTVQANFMGVGANNATIVANGGDGLLISGTSNNTQVGGVIPLGNVISGNNRNGIEVRDTASGFTSFNTFAGLYAFGAAAPNKLDGILITSTGGNNLIRTTIASGNLGNGIELGGDATGVQVTDTAVGTNANINTTLPNQGNGILISGHAHGNAIGGFQASIEPQVTISSNDGYGIKVVGSAHDNIIFHSYIGTSYNDTIALGNEQGGIFLGKGTSNTTIGGALAPLQNLIVNNGGPGVTIQSSGGNSVIGNNIQANGQDGIDVSGKVSQTHVQANAITGNAGNGVLLDGTQGVAVGGSSAGLGNQITNNLGFGLEATGTCSETYVQGNVITSNAAGNVNLTKSKGVVSVS